MTQKITRVGNSAAVIIPKSILEESGLKVGSNITVAYKADLGNVVIELPRKRSATNVIIDKEVFAVANDLLKRYLPAFKKLAKPLP
ncbi:AbrB/MazE/SpoVT family DNA-binding domain-containing protein [Patescibacteria group bacterium]|nr:AbrB/MazE/SpoVT family DNA-binding domain-containing protein [Patescibacteria group bacterium]MBU1472876.1 AbrB/MazE/SpoVT family DNA-binding domain-containing protein [Patescibacteria group bacterium]MBU2460062.1 AbrB/MazE/SpoVT family DNA-binding domain-containing protein [Patescibacteria group bacterium]MBU2544758.1 AbrB/MazE/SpoVT family DNA-binding domain-containing protein [Patescibacteria group bacterium]